MLKHSLYGVPSPKYGGGVGHKKPNAEFSFLDAMRDGDLDTMRLLLQEDPSLAFRKDGDGKTPLHKAAARGIKGMAETLLANNADVNAKDTNGVTPLHDAVYIGQKELAEFLLANHADVNARNDKGWKYGMADRECGWEAGWTPLHDAAFRGFKDLAALLVANHADVNAKGVGGVTPLCLAAAKGNNDLVELLLDNGAKTDSTDGYGKSPLFLAAERERFELVVTLLARKADINARDSQGKTPLHCLAGGDSKKGVKFLLDNGAALEAKDNSGMTPLHICTLRGHIHVAELLLENGADVNAKDNSGMTPLHFATSKGHSALAALLLASGAHVNAKATDGSLPTDAAIRSGTGRMKKLLRAASGETSVGIWHWTTEGAFWGAGIIGAITALRTIYNLAVGDFSALIFWILIPAVVFGRNYKGRIALWGFVAWAIIVNSPVGRGFSFDIVRTQRFFFLDLGASVGGWIAIALFAGIFGISSGMVVGSIVGYARTRGLMTTTNARIQGYKDFVFGFAVPLTIFVAALYGYFKLFLPFVQKFFLRHLPEI